MNNVKKAGRDGDRAIPHQRTRRDHANETAEDYVEAVADIIEENGECRVKDLAKFFDVSHVTVSRIVSRLKTEGLMSTRPYHPIQLTDSGVALAKSAKSRHQIVFDFLILIGVDQKTAAVDSEGIEHHVSQKTLNAMKRALRNKSEGRSNY